MVSEALSYQHTYKFPWRVSLTPPLGEPFSPQAINFQTLSKPKLEAELQARVADIVTFTNTTTQFEPVTVTCDAGSNQDLLYRDLARYYSAKPAYSPNFGQKKADAIVRAVIDAGISRVGDIARSVLNQNWRTGTLDPTHPTDSYTWHVATTADCIETGELNDYKGRRIPLKNRTIRSIGDVSKLPVPQIMSPEEANAFYNGEHQFENGAVADCGTGCQIRHLCNTRRVLIPAIAESIERHYQMKNLADEIRLAIPESELTASIFEILYTTAVKNGLNPSRGQTEAMIQLAIVLDNKTKTDTKPEGYKLGLYEAIGGAGKSELFRSITPAFEEISDITGHGFQLEIDGTPGVYNTSTSIDSPNQVLISLGREAMTNGELDIKIPVKGFTHDEVTRLLAERHQGEMVPAYVKAARENCLGSMAIADSIYKSLQNHNANKEDTKSIERVACQEAALFLVDRLFPIMNLDDNDYHRSGLIGSKASLVIGRLVKKYWYHSIDDNSLFDIADAIETIIKQSPITGICEEFQEYPELKISEHDLDAIKERYFNLKLNYRNDDEPRLVLAVDLSGTNRQDLDRFKDLFENLVVQQRKVKFMVFYPDKKQDYVIIGSEYFNNPDFHRLTHAGDKPWEHFLLLVSGDHTALPRGSTIRAAALTEMFFRAKGLIPDLSVWVRGERQEI